jgi:hypothetical protein
MTCRTKIFGSNFVNPICACDAIGLVKQIKSSNPVRSLVFLRVAFCQQYYLDELRFATRLVDLLNRFCHSSLRLSSSVK